MHRVPKLGAVVGLLALTLSLVVSTPAAEGQQSEAPGALIGATTDRDAALPTRPATGSDEATKIGAGVLPALQQTNGSVSVIVTTKLADPRVAITTSPSELAGLEASVATSRTRLEDSPPDGVSVDKTYDYVPAVAMSIDSEAALDALAARSDVAHIALDEAMSAHLGGTVPLVGADNRHAGGNNADGVTVVVMDSGIDTNHPDLFDDVLSGQACFGDSDGVINGIGFCPNGSDRQFGPGAAEDDQGHGTHVSGIITSNGTQAPVGVAPGAEILAIKFLNSANVSLVGSETLAAWDWLIANQATIGADVLNMSFGGGATYVNDCDAANPASFTAMATLRSMGILPVASAGNAGTNTMAHPACLSNVVAVGASTDTDLPTSFTDSNTTTDLFAPGNVIESSALGGGSTNLSGTSMAAPHVSGCAALLVDAGEAPNGHGTEERLETSHQLIDHFEQLFPRLECDITSPAICAPDDSLENNDTLGTATAIGPNQNFPAIACDNDYYTFDAAVGDIIDLDITFDDSNGDLQLELYDPSNSLVASSTSATDDESIDHTAASAGSYTARVFGAGGDDNRYVFGLDAGPAICPPDDEYEPNESTNTATPLPLSSFDGILCNTDVYVFFASAGATITVDLLFSNAVGNLDLVLLDPALNGIDFGFTDTDNEQVSVVAASTGLYYVAPIPFQGSQAPYTLNTTITGIVNICGGLPVTVNIGLGQAPTNGNDVILGTAAGETINAMDGSDTVCALGGDDTVIGGPGADAVLGNTGNDTISGNADNDFLDGGPGRDRAFGGSGNDFVVGNFGNDFALGGSSGSDSVLGGEGNDVLSGGSDSDVTVNGGPGDDAVNGGRDNDTSVLGGPGNDTVSGNGGADVIDGGPGNDAVRGGMGNDTVFGGLGDDFVAGNDGVDTCDGGGGLGDSAAINCEIVLNVP